VLLLLESTELTKAELDLFLTPHDLNRLEKYAQNMVDYHMVMDLMPTLARLYFTRRLDISLNELKLVSFADCLCHIGTGVLLPGTIDSL